MKAGRSKAELVDSDADRARALALTPVSRETLARLDVFVDLLRHWQKTTNLVAASTLDDLWVRHVADSLQLLQLAPDARIWVDLGSGGGFPGIAIACQMARHPGAEVHLVERNAKKAAFLREAARAAGAPAIIHAVNIEDCVDRLPPRIDCVTARALAPLKVLLPLVAPMMERGAIALLPKGQDVDAELTEASKYWIVNFERVPSLTSHEGTIVRINALRRAT